MALTLNNFIGFETNDLSEALAVSDTPTFVTTPVHSGDFALVLDSGGEKYRIPIILGGTTDSDNDFLLGWAFRVDALPSQQRVLINAEEDDGAPFSMWSLYLETDGDLTLKDTAGSTVVTTTSTPIAKDTWYFFEIRWQHSDSGSFDWHVDGVSVISETGVDTSRGGDISADNARYTFVYHQTTGFIDSIYCKSGAAGTGDFLSAVEIFRYQANTNSVSPDNGNDLDAGVWQDLGETPIGSDATPPAYTGGTLGGNVHTNDTQSVDNFRPGPKDDDNIDGDSNIKAGKWLHRMKRGNGGGTEQYARYGNSVDTIKTSADLDLPTSFTNTFIISEAADTVPLSTEYFSHGMAKNGGAQDLEAEEIFSFILHVPDAAAPAATRPPFSGATFMSPGVV